jgi:hypothetical protein
MGRYESGSFAGLSCLWIGMMTAIFQLSGTYEDSGRVLNRWSMWFLFWSFRFLSMLLWTRPIAWLLRLLIPNSSSIVFIFELRPQGPSDHIFELRVNSCLRVVCLSIVLGVWELFVLSWELRVKSCLRASNSRVTVIEGDLTVPLRMENWFRVLVL